VVYKFGILAQRANGATDVVVIEVDEAQFSIYSFHWRDFDYRRLMRNCLLQAYKKECGGKLPDNLKTARCYGDV
jgi:hypothetical protein